MIVVTGASGKLGRLVIAELLNRVPAAKSSRQRVTPSMRSTYQRSG